MGRGGKPPRIIQAVLGLFLLVCASGRGAAEPGPPADILILFDQSGSMGRYDPRLASKAWLMTFVKTFASSHRIAVVGFDEALHEHLVVDTGNAGEAASLGPALDAIAIRGKATDLEMPFRHLEERARPETKLALIVTDGEPEIWDAKLGYLSRHVLEDRAYDGINQAYRDMRAAGASEKDLFEQLGHRYFTRNIDLIESHLAPLGKMLGGKLIIWDLSGKSYYLRTWAKAAGAQYLPMRVAATENPAEHLRQAMLDLQRKSSVLIQEALPADHDARAEAVLTAIPEVGPVSSAAKPDPAPASPPSPAPVPPAPPESVLPTPPESVPSTPPESVPQAEKDGGVGILPWALPVLALVAVAAFLFGRRREDERAPPEAAPPEVVLPEVAPSVAPVAVSDAEDASRFIAEKVQNALDDAEKLRRRLLVDESDAIDREDRRFSLRVTVPEGAMDIHWTDGDGNECHGSAVDISMQGVRFLAPVFDAVAISRVVCPRMGLSLNVVQSTISRHDGRHAVAVLGRFENNLDDWMRWVEIVTRIDQDASGE
ncbi:MAG: VWA domain-containing protein [Alphaproteobacteria bacterium]|nr:VWA domain-containing protein [Alphaproteobacteria bacterium]